MQIPVSRSIDTQTPRTKLPTYREQLVVDKKEYQIDDIETRSLECDLHHIQNVRIYQSQWAGDE